MVNKKISCIYLSLVLCVSLFCGIFCTEQSVFAAGKKCADLPSSLVEACNDYVDVECANAGSVAGAYDTCVDGFATDMQNMYNNCSGNATEEFCVNAVVSAYSASEGTGGGSSGSTNCDTNILNDFDCNDDSSIEGNAIWGLLRLVINILTGLIGAAAIGGFVYGGILYATAAESPDKVKKAKSTIINVVIGLVAYALLYSFLNFIIPGGVFGV